jgi:hypothetical protein
MADPRWVEYATSLHAPYGRDLAAATPRASGGGARTGASHAAAAARGATCLLACVLTLGCGAGAPGRDEPGAAAADAGTAGFAGGAVLQDSARVVAVGGAAAGRLAGGLIGPLTAAVEAGGPAGAIDFCSREALALTMAIEDSIGGGVTLKRTTLRPRNQNNAPDEYERRVLEELHALADRGEPLPPHVLQSAHGEARFYRPLMVQPLCIPCHGPADQLDPAVRAMLRDRYPDDQAIGYRDGDLRGVIRVNIPAAGR